MRIMLDHNIWSDIGTEAGARIGLESLLIERALTLVKQPTPLLEAAADGDQERSCEVIEAFALAPGVDTLPDGFLETEELAAALAGCGGARCLRSVPDANGIVEFRLRWARYQGEAQRHPGRFREILRREVLPIIRRQAAAYQAVQAANRENKRLRQATARGHLANQADEADLPDGYRDLRPGASIDVWRVALGQYLTFQFLQPAGEELDGYSRYWFDLEACKRADVQQELLRRVVLDVHPPQVARWLTGHLISMLQLRHSWRKSSGDPGDEKHAGYFVDADYFFTADANFYSEIRDASAVLPFAIARPVLVEGAGASVIARLRAAAQQAAHVRAS